MILFWVLGLVLPFLEVIFCFWGVRKPKTGVELVRSRAWGWGLKKYSVKQGERGRWGGFLGFLGHKSTKTSQKPPSPLSQGGEILKGIFYSKKTHRVNDESFFGTF